MESLLSTYKGTHINDLPTPCFIINEDKFNSNCQLMLENVNCLSKMTNTPIKFRPHIKTHKTIKGTKKQLGHDIFSTQTESIVVSTLKEATEILNYQDQYNDHFVKDICYGLPACVPGIIEKMSSLTRRVENFRIFVDNVQHLDNLLCYGRPASGEKWSIFLKIDMGTHRAGIEFESSEYLTIIRRLFSPEVQEIAELYGCYAHAGHSYDSSNIVDSHLILLEEVSAVNNAAMMVKKHFPEFNVSNLVLSVGATPTSNSLRLTDEPVLISYITKKLVGQLEIHCGNYCLYDLQQLSTHCINDFEISGYVIGTVISEYKERKESLTNTGVLALTKESSRFKGYGLCINPEEITKQTSYNIKTYIDRVSQEHGILKAYKNSGSFGEFKIGSKVAIIPQHSCIVMGQFPYYFILNKDLRVTDIWIPFQKW